MKNAFFLMVCLASIAVAAAPDKMGMSDKPGLHEAMMAGSQEMQSMPMTGDVDRDFVEGMAMHHRQAIKMSEIELRDGKDAKAKAFAKKIIAAQKKEIKELELWLSTYPKK